MYPEQKPKSSTPLRPDCTLSRIPASRAGDLTRRPVPYTVAQDNAAASAQQKHDLMRLDDVTSETDARLVRRARDGDRSAFEMLVRRHLRAAYAVALAELVDSRDAEDAVQDAFITALERLEDCRDPAAFSAWLRRIVRNRARSVRRRERVRDTSSLDTVLTARSKDDPARDLERTDTRKRLEAALGMLTDVQRQVVLMHDLEGFRHREIAAELGLPEGTVRSHLFLARRALRELLGGTTEGGRSDERQD
jgi:RNA polymerase sigma-70 factor, ECF subfamily